MHRGLRFLLLAVPLAACSDSTGSSSTSASGTWRVATVNGVPLPVPTAAGQTLTHVTLAVTGGFANGTGGPLGGSLGICLSAQDTVTETIYTVDWTEIGDTLFFTYPNNGIAAPVLDTALVDTALVVGDTMTWHAKGVEPLLGTSQWTLRRSFGDPCFLH